MPELSRPTSPAPAAAALVRDAITLGRVTSVCPKSAIAASIARRFALEPVDYAAVRESHEEAIGRMANAFGETLGERATAKHFQRLVGALVTSALKAGRFHSEKVTRPATLTAELANDAREEDREGSLGFREQGERGHAF